MKNILIFRSANYEVINKLMEYIRSKNETVKIYFLVQQSSLDILKEKYNNVTFITLKDNAFNYKSFKKDENLKKELKLQKYDEIYIPSSTDNFEGFKEIKNIVSTITKENVTLFDMYGRIKRINLKNITWSFVEDNLYIIKKNIIKKYIISFKIKFEYHIKINKNIWNNNF